MKCLAAFISIALYLASSGCTQQPLSPPPIADSVKVSATRPAYTPQIVYRGTKAFEARVASFKVTPESARSLVNKSGNVGWDVSWQACIVDDWYLFTRPYKYKRIDLAGIYVNGFTAQVQRRSSELSLLGDNSLIGTLKDSPSDMPESISEARRYR